MCVLGHECQVRVHYVRENLELRVMQYTSFGRYIFTPGKALGTPSTDGIAKPPNR